jgi:cytochrome c oxidase subunit 2
MRFLLTLLLLLVPVLGVYTFVTAEEYGWWLPEVVSSFGPDIDRLFYLILWMVTFFFVLTELVLVYAVFRYAKKQSSKCEYTHGNHRLELIWTGIPAALLLVIAFSQMGTWAQVKFRGHFPESKPLAQVWASQFDWRFQYPGPDGEFGTMDDLENAFEFVVPVGEKVVLNLHSRDVLHSFSVLEFRLKQDAVPGLTIPMWFEALEVGEYDLICMELCGWGHYKMAGRVRVVSREDYDDWLETKQAEFMSNGMEEGS